MIQIGCPQMLDTASRKTRSSRTLNEHEKRSENFNEFE